MFSCLKYSHGLIYLDNIVKKFLKVLSVLALALACNAKAAKPLPPCFTPGFYFGLGVGFSNIIGCKELRD